MGLQPTHILITGNSSNYMPEVDASDILFSQTKDIQVIIIKQNIGKTYFRCRITVVLIWDEYYILVLSYIRLTIGGKQFT